MRTRVSYKGRIIESLLFPVRGGGWTAHFFIENHRGPDLLDSPFQTGHVFPTQDAALGASLQMGKQKIDTGFGNAPTQQ
jgi:hypothetical protein